LAVGHALQLTIVRTISAPRSLISASTGSGIIADRWVVARPGRRPGSGLPSLGGPSEHDPFDDSARMAGGPPGGSFRASRARRHPEQADATALSGSCARPRKR